MRNPVHFGPVFRVMHLKKDPVTKITKGFNVNRKILSSVFRSNVPFHEDYGEFWVHMCFFHIIMSEFVMAAPHSYCGGHQTDQISKRSFTADTVYLSAGSKCHNSIIFLDPPAYLK
jgi:hypothetical protein